MTTEEKKARDAEPGANSGEASQRLGWFESSTTFEDVVEEQGARPFVWPEPPDEEDKFDVDEFLGAIFGDKMRR